MAKTALITGINGQDGSFLAELLLARGYNVHGIVRRSSLEDDFKLRNLTSIRAEINLHAGALDNPLFLYKLIESVRPEECYHLGAQSFVSHNFEDESSALMMALNSTNYLLSSILELVPKCRFLLAGSSEMFGDPSESPQSENTKFNPRSLYGISKVAAHFLVRRFRDKNGLFACTAISYNHESPRRGTKFISRRVSLGVAEICSGLRDHILLGNLDAIRDWGSAPEYVEAMWMILNASEPQDFVLSTGVGRTVKELVCTAFDSVGLDYRKYVDVDPMLFRESDPTPLVGDHSKITRCIGWRPKRPFNDIISEMVQSDINALSCRPLKKSS